MPSMIENLIGGATTRPDEKRLLPIRRPMPGRPRDVLELFVALGEEATIKSVMLAADFRDADPRPLTYVVLNRWPTAEELAGLPNPFVPQHYLRTLLLGQEFRTSLFRRICDAYPERPRQLFVCIPRCAGEHFLQMAHARHPLFTNSLVEWRRNDGAEVIPRIGRYLGRFTATRTIMAALPSLKPFVTAPIPTEPDGTALSWALNPPPFRTIDRLFTIVREPAAIVLGMVNAILGRLQQQSSNDDDPTRKWRRRFDPLPGLDDSQAWQQIGHRLLRALPVRNPICTALGDGTADDALRACRQWNVEIADISLYESWLKYTWETEAGPPTNSAPRIMTQQNLGAAASAHLADLIAEDTEFYRYVVAAHARLGEAQTSIRGKDL
jgi:hypothetical protein